MSTLPPLQPSAHKRRVSQPNGAICLVPAYSDDEAHAYGAACAAAAVAAERERCAAILDANAQCCDGLTAEILASNAAAIREGE